MQYLSRTLLLLILLYSSQSMANERNLTVVTLSPHLVEIMYAIDAGDQIIATVDYSDFPQQAQKIQTIGNHYGLNIETILALKPDLILAWDTGNPVQQLQQLTALGIEVKSFSPQSIEELFNDIEVIGSLVGKKHKAVKVVEKISQQLALIRQQNQHKAPVSVFYEIWPKPLRTIGSEKWINGLLKVCGARNIFAHLKPGYPVVNPESVIQKNPQVIIKPTQNNKLPGPDIWHRWPELEAVDKQQIFAINADLLHRFSPRFIIGLQQLCPAIDKARNRIN